MMFSKDAPRIQVKDLKFISLKPAEPAPAAETPPFPSKSRKSLRSKRRDFLSSRKGGISVPHSGCFTAEDLFQ
jgi:hypothetical protein